MFGDNDNTHELADLLLDLYSLEELLELNDMTEIELVAHLLEAGLLGEPSSIIETYETQEEDE
jgi:hypothetical protein